MRYKIMFFLVAGISLSIVQPKEQNLSVNSLDYNVNYDILGNEFVNAPVLLDSIDAGVIAIYLPDTIGYGDRVRPVAKIKNFGSATADIPTRMKIGSSYNQVRSKTLGSCCEDTLNFPLWAAFTVSRVTVSCSTELFGDQNPENDRLIDTIYVRRFSLDIGVDTIFELVNGIQGIIRNFGSMLFTDILPVVFAGYTLDTSLIYYNEIIVDLLLVPDDSIPVEDLFFGLDLVSVEIVANDSNPSNNKKFKRINSGPIFEEFEKPLEPICLPKLTIMRNNQFKSHIINSEPEAEIFGINGSRIKVEKVREGIYFIKTRTGNKKVVIIK